MSGVHEMDCLGEETVPVSGRSGAQRRPDGSSSKRECAGCEGSRVIIAGFASNKLV